MCGEDWFSGSRDTLPFPQHTHQMSNIFVSTHPSVYTWRPRRPSITISIPLRMVKNVGSGIRLPRFELLICYLPVLDLCKLITSSGPPYKMGTWSSSYILIERIKWASKFLTMFSKSIDSRYYCYLWPIRVESPCLHGSLSMSLPLHKQSHAAEFWRCFS